MTNQLSEASPIMAALEQFEATEANLIKLERLWSELSSMIPKGPSFGANLEYEDRARSYGLLLTALPKIDGWKPSAEPPNLDDLAQNRLDAVELEISNARASIELWLDKPGKELREYRFRLNGKRKSLIRKSLIELVEKIDSDIMMIRKVIKDTETIRDQIKSTVWTEMREHLKQVGVLLGSSMERPRRWYDMFRHISFGYVGDFYDIDTTDWPQIKTELRNGLYGTNEALPVEADDLESLVASQPGGPVTTALSWEKLEEESFERLIFNLITNTQDYENPQWLMQTRAPDRGRDLSVTRISKDKLSGTSRARVIIQCKHWLNRSVAMLEVAVLKEQMALWHNPKVDVLIIVTSGRFTSDAVQWIESHNASGMLPKIEMWPDSHLEQLLASRPAIIAEFGLRT